MQVAVGKFQRSGRNFSAPLRSVLTVKDVPVDAFWSVTTYNAGGGLDAGDLGVNSYNNASAEPNDDGSQTIPFGGRGDGRVNCIPIDAYPMLPTLVISICRFMFVCEVKAVW